MSDRKIPSINVKLAGPANYPVWLTIIKLAFRLAKVGSRRVWALVDGNYAKPSTPPDEVQEWDDGNDFVPLTIFKNCEENVRSKIETWMWS